MKTKHWEHYCNNLPDRVIAIPYGEACPVCGDLPPPPSALDTQVAGSHYKDMVIQPFQYIHANGIGFAEGCAIKYLSRWRAKGGVEDLRKARHFIEMLIELETKK